MTREEAHALIDRGLSETPWVVTRTEIAAALEVLDLDPHQENFVWEYRYGREDQAVGGGLWPVDVPIPHGVEPWPAPS